MVIEFQVIMCVYNIGNEEAPPGMAGLLAERGFVQ
jgi:hypothetical protein